MAQSVPPPRAPRRPEAEGAGASAAEAWLHGATGAIVLTTVTVTAVAALGAIIGADARWLAALGGLIARTGTIPTGVPFASAPTTHWHNAVVLAELTFHGLEATLGDRGLMLAQLLAVAAAVVVLMGDAYAAGASPAGASLAVLVAAIGAAPSLLIARVQLFSLVLFPLLAALVRREARERSRRIWLVLPLIALWSNLHGAVLIGEGVLFVYLALIRFRQDAVTTIGVGAGAVAALCLTPAGLGTISYYQGLLTNEAAARGDGLWAPLSLTAPLDLVLIIAVVVLALKLRRIRPPAWELVAVLVLAVATVHASRSGVWLVMFLAVPAARGFTSSRWWDRIMPPLAVLALGSLVFAIVRGPLPSGAGDAILARGVALARGTPILADDVIGEEVVLAGGRIWVGDPLDAFSKRDQTSYLNWSDGRRSGLRALGNDVRVVMTTRGSPAQRLMSHDTAFADVESDGRSVLYVRSQR